MTGFSSGEEKTSASSTVSSEHGDERDHRLLDEVVPPLRALPLDARVRSERVLGCAHSFLPSIGMGGTTPRPTNEQHVACDQDPDEERQEHDVPEQHLAEVEDVEERADARGVEPVLRLPADPLRVEVLLGQVPREGGSDRDEERDRAGDPGHAPVARARPT